MHGQVNYIYESNGRGHTLNTRLEKYTPALAWRINGTLNKYGDKRSPNYFLNNTGSEEASEEAAEETASDGLCAQGDEGETIYVHQQAGREGPLAAILGEAFALATSDAVGEINNDGGVCGATLEVIYRETQ